MEEQTDETSLSLSLLQDEINKLSRRVDTVQKTVDLLYQDRSILEDMQGAIRSVQEVLLHNRQHTESAIKDVKQEVIESQVKTESKLQEMKTVVDDGVGVLVKEIVKPKINKSWWDQVKGLYPFKQQATKSKTEKR